MDCKQNQGNIYHHTLGVGLGEELKAQASDDVVNQQQVIDGNDN